jgi:hypothetical protein
LTGATFEAEWTTEHPASSYGQPVLVLKETGEAVDAWGYERIDNLKKSVNGQRSKPLR